MTITPRQSEIAELLRHGMTNAQIARRLGISPNTVRAHLHSAYERMSAPNRTALVAAYLASLQTRQ